MELTKIEKEAFGDEYSRRLKGKLAHLYTKYSRLKDLLFAKNEAIRRRFGVGRLYRRAVTLEAEIKEILKEYYEFNKGV